MAAPDRSEQCQLIVIDIQIQRFLDIAVVNLSRLILRLTLLSNHIVLRLMQRLYELHRPDIKRTGLLALGLETLLRYEYLSINIFRISVLMPSAECHLYLRMLVIADRHEI